MSNRNYAGRFSSSVSHGFAHGLAQMSSLGKARPFVRTSRANSVVEAMRGDWLRLGGDMAVAIEKAHEGACRKPERD